MIDAIVLYLGVVAVAGLGATVVCVLINAWMDSDE